MRLAGKGFLPCQLGQLGQLGAYSTISTMVGQRSGWARVW